MNTFIFSKPSFSSVGVAPNDPDTPVNGDVWYNTATNQLMARINGVNVALGAGGGGSGIGKALPPTYNEVFTTPGATTNIVVANYPNVFPNVNDYAHVTIAGGLYASSTPPSANITAMALIHFGTSMNMLSANINVLPNTGWRWQADVVRTSDNLVAYGTMTFGNITIDSAGSIAGYGGNIFSFFGKADASPDLHISVDIWGNNPNANDPTLGIISQALTTIEVFNF